MTAARFTVDVGRREVRLDGWRRFGIAVVALRWGAAKVGSVTAASVGVRIFGWGRVWPVPEPFSHLLWRILPDVEEP